MRPERRGATFANVHARGRGGQYRDRPRDGAARLRYLRRRPIRGTTLLSRARELLIFEEREAGALAVLDEPLHDDIGRELVGVVDPLAAHS
jgi:hypothetical protein